MNQVNKVKNIAVIGLGYVGLPLACLCAYKGMHVSGVDTDNNKVALIQKGVSPFMDQNLPKELMQSLTSINATTDIRGAVGKSEVIVVCVPTPVNNEHLPDLKSLKEACTGIAESIVNDSLVIIESTISPGTTEDVVLPILKKSGKKFFLAHCPERIDPGNLKYTIRNLPRVLAGIDDESTEKAFGFYKSIIDAEIMRLRSVKAAEATKIMENTFRDVNIAFVNEMAKSFDKAGIDITEVIKGASTKPFGFMPHYPGAGVGGHCIAVDPYYLISKAKQMGFSHDFLILARKINESMPDYVVQLLNRKLKSAGVDIRGAKVGILGIAYKPEVSDVRESPFFKVKSILAKKEAKLEVYDPYVKEYSTVSSMDEILEISDYLLLITGHKEFTDLEITKFREKKIKIIIDGRNCLDMEKIKELGIVYHGIGRN
jgi:UDP-N-acetyl-D-glucosamine dehydrogenase